MKNEVIKSISNLFHKSEDSWHLDGLTLEMVTVDIDAELATLLKVSECIAEHTKWYRIQLLMNSIFQLCHGPERNTGWLINTIS